MYDDDEDVQERNCERCGDYAPCELIPLMGVSLFMCRKCAAAAYRNGEAA